MADHRSVPVRWPHASKGCRPRARRTAGRRSRTAVGREPRIGGCGLRDAVGRRTKGRQLSVPAPLDGLPGPGRRSAAADDRHRQPQRGLAVRWRRHGDDRRRAAGRTPRRLASDRDPHGDPRADRVRDRPARARDSLGGERRVPLLVARRRRRRHPRARGRRVPDDLMVEHMGRRSAPSTPRASCTSSRKTSASSIRLATSSSCAARCSPTSGSAS